MATEDWPRLADPLLDLSGPTGPTSALYGDGYASAAGAAEETKTVFLDAVGAPDVWRQRSDFSIGETGFGLGLNFLLTWSLWRTTAAPGARLHYVSVEGHPLSRDAMTAALAPYAKDPDLAALAADLCRAYPVRHAGYHRLVFDGGRVRLTLLFGHVEEMLAGLGGAMDAWFLDGFSPAKNPDMWAPAVLDRIGHRTRAGGVVATYTAAGAVRRALTDAGFRMEKRPGYAGKRERLVGTKSITSDNRPPEVAPWHAPPPAIAPGGKVAIVGAGIAGQWLYRTLRQRGVSAALFDRAGHNGGMAGNPGAMLLPKLHLKPTPPGRLQASAFLHALRSYEDLGEPVWLEPKGAWLETGDVARTEGTVRALSWPEEILKIDRLSGRSVQYFASSGCLDTDRVKGALAPEIETATIGRIEESDGGWRLTDPEGAPIWDGEAVIVAAGGWSGLLLGSPELGIRPSRGQVSFIDGKAAGLPDRAFGSDGYLTPPVRFPDGAFHRIVGSTFDAERRPDADSAWRAWRRDDHDRYAGPIADRLALTLPAPSGGWAGLRATTADKLPLVGGVPDTAAYRSAYDGLRHGDKHRHYPPAPYRKGLYILSGLGARGYMFTPLMAELLTDLMFGTPPALPRDLIDAVHPARFLVRALRRNADRPD